MYHRQERLKEENRERGWRPVVQFHSCTQPQNFTCSLTESNVCDCRSLRGGHGS